MPIHKAPDVEPIRGYRLLEPLGQGGFGEVWKCEAPGGIYKAIKFVYGDLNGLDIQRFRAEEELRAFQLIKSIRHPFLLSIDRVENIDGELIIITELADHNLHDVKVEHQTRGLPGIPRAELLGYLREAAEVLDLMNHKFDLQHLDIKPRNLFVLSDHVKVADFGLVNRLSAKDAKIQTGAITPLYTAPELFENKMSRQCDQYSLAIVFQELLTGTPPFAGNPRQLMLAHLQREPNLAALPEADRAIVAKALSKDPDERYPSCLEFLRALAGDASAGTLVESMLDINVVRQAETSTAQPGDTQRLRLHPKPSAPLHVTLLPGLRFGDCVATGPLQDVWKAHDLDGRKRLVKIIYGFANDAKRVQEAVVQLRAVHHPALVVNDVAHVEPGRLVIVTDPVKQTLRDRFQECTERHQTGIGRRELLDHLRAAAEVLDYLSQQYGLYHLNLHPRQLILDHGWLQIAEFGFAQLLWLPGGQDIAAGNTRYAAPEVFARTPGRTSDQYSLALIFAEMLTGQHPFQGLNAAARRGAARSAAAPNLERLAPVDREVIARALHPDPQRRWPNCTDMMLALEGASLERLHEVEQQHDHFTKLIADKRNAEQKAPIAIVTDSHLNATIRKIIAKAGGADNALADTPIAPLFQEDLIEHKFRVGVPLGVARSRMEGFPQPWFGQVIRDDDHGLVFRISLPTSFWQQLFKKRTGLEVCVRMARVNPMSATPIEVATTVQPLRKNHGPSRELLDDLGPEIIENLQQLLLNDSNKRRQDRLLWPHPLKVTPILPDGRSDEPIQCRGRDLSHTGIGFYLPHDLSTSEVLIELPNDIQPPSIWVPATLVRAKRCADGWYEVGALFRVPLLRKSFPEIKLPPVEQNAAT